MPCNFQEEPMTSIGIETIRKLEIVNTIAVE